MKVVRWEYSTGGLGSLHGRGALLLGGHCKECGMYSE